MTGRGPDIQLQLQHGIIKSSQAISQLLQFSCHKRERMQIPRDTPFAVCVVFLLFATAYRNSHNRWCSHVNAKIPGAAKTFDVYAKDVIAPLIESYAERYTRVDVVFDISPG